MLSYYLEFQEEVVTRRTQFDLDKALARMHIVEGLLKALDNIDEVINILRSSKTRDEAKTRLMDRFEFTEIQVNAICDMRLIRLIGLEREKLETEKNDLTAFIAEMRAILADKNKLITVIKNELIEIRDKYGDARRTRFVADMGEINYEDLIADDMSVITMTQMNYVKRIGLDTYRIQNRGGKGIKGMQTREDPGRASSSPEPWATATCNCSTIDCKRRTASRGSPFLMEIIRSGNGKPPERSKLLSGGNSFLHS